MYNAISNLSTVTSALKALGIQEKLCDDPSKLTDEINKLVEEYTEETQDKIEAVLSKVDFTTLVYVAVDIFTSAIGGIASEWYDKIVNEFWNGKIKGGLTSILSSIMSLVPGAILFFQYAAVKSLRTNLQYRIELTQLLKKDLNFLIQILTSYLTLFKDVEDSYDDLDDAIKELTLAVRILAIEISKSQTTYYIISKDAFLKANLHIEKAIDLLGMGSQTVGQQILDRVHRKYNLKTAPPTIGEQINPMYWVKYFENLNKEIAKRFTGDEGKKTALAIARELFPFFPKFLQLLLLQSRVNQATITLREKTPVITSDRLYNPTISIFGTNITKDIIGDTLKGIYDSALQFFGYEKSKDAITPRFYLNPETKDLTIQDLISRVKSYEAIILSLETMWEFITAAAQPYIELAKSALNSVEKTRIDMISTKHDIDHKMILGNDKYLAKKLEWISELTLAKGYISSAVSDYAGFQVPLKRSSTVRAITGLQVAELLMNSNIIYEELKQIIIAKKVDLVTGAIQKEPIEKGYNLSQSALIKLLGNVAIIAAPSEAIHLIAELKAIEFTYNEQYKLDIVEFNKCNSYISLLENSRLFTDIEKSMRFYLESLQKVPTFSSAISNALEGNLTPIVQTVGDTATITDSILSCLGVDTPDFASALKMLDKVADNTFSVILDSIEDSLISIKTELQNTTEFILEATNTIKSANDYVKSVEIINSNSTSPVQIPSEASVLIPFIK